MLTQGKKRKWDNRSNFKQIHVPFKERIPAGHSTFNVDVPSIYANRDLFFSSLIILPDFYSKEAQAEDLEDETVLNTPINYDVTFKCIFIPTEPPFHPAEYILPGDIGTSVELVHLVNEHFEANKPLPCVHTCAFFDWTDLRFNKNDEDWDYFVQNDMALTYYNEEYDEAKHFNALPLTARTVHGANNYLFPTNITPLNTQNLRYRLVLAANTKASFSTNSQLGALGFDPLQIGTKGNLNKYHMKNGTTKGFKFITAKEPRNVKIVAKPMFKMRLIVNNNTFLSQTATLTITKGNSLKDSIFTSAVNTGLDKLVAQTNLQFNLTYNDTERQYTFNFPKAQAIAVSGLLVPPEFSERLGFDLATEINFNFPKGIPIPDPFDIKKTEAKARALGYDTGVIIVSDYNTASNTTAGINEQFMCSLYPTATGSFEIPLLESCFKPPTMSLPKFFSSSVSGGTVPATFKLSRYLDDDKLEELNWKNGAFASGILRGKELEL